MDAHALKPNHYIFFSFPGRQRRARSGREALPEEESCAYPKETPSVVPDAVVPDEPTYCICKEVTSG